MILALAFRIWGHTIVPISKKYVRKALNNLPYVERNHTAASSSYFTLVLANFQNVSPERPKVDLSTQNFAQIVTTGAATEGRCGHCEGCCRKPCKECSSCKRHNYEDCIDLYCVNQKSGLSERAAIRELYLQSLKKQSEEVTFSYQACYKPSVHFKWQYCDPLGY